MTFPPKHSYLLKTTALLMALAVTDVSAMDDRGPISITGTGMQLKRSVTQAVLTLKQRADQGDENAISAIATNGGTQAAVEVYNRIVSAPSPRLQPQSGSPGGSYSNYGPMPSMDFEHMTLDEMRRLTEESDAQINARIAEIASKYNNDTPVTLDEENELEFLTKQLEEILPDRMSYGQYKAKGLADAQKKKLGADVMREKNAEKTREQKERKEALMARYKEKYDQVRAQFKALSPDDKDKLAYYYRNSTLWKLLYRSENVTDFRQDRVESGDTYARVINLEILGLRQMNQDELEALTYLIDQIPNDAKRNFLQEQVDLRLRSGSVTPESSITYGLKKTNEAPSGSGSSGSAAAAAAYPQSSSAPPPPPQGGPAAPPPPPSSSTANSNSTARPKVSDSDLQAQMAKLKKPPK